MVVLLLRLKWMPPFVLLVLFAASGSSAWLSPRRNSLLSRMRFQLPLLPASYNSINDRFDDPDPFQLAMVDLGYTKAQQESIISQLVRAGLWENENSSNLMVVTNDFTEAHSAAVSSFLIQDFGIAPLIAHQTRAALHQALAVKKSVPMESPAEATKGDESAGKKPTFKAVVLDAKAKRRSSAEYGLPRNYAKDFPVTGQEMQDFFGFMTVASTDSQETPIRAATANTYIRHAKLFLGWYWNHHLPAEHKSDEFTKADISLYKIFPTKSKESADSVLAFLSWLRSTRQISVSYEANLLRGLGKLIKFRFRKESSADDSDKSFDDIPALRELRKLHRDANRRQAVAPRVSDEAQKWLAWPDYLQVVESARKDVRALILVYDTEFANSVKLTARQRQRKESRQRGIASGFQKFLILAFFASVPDRQRTMRELEIGRSFVKDDQQWCIKHSPDDYKTGKTYGERPPLLLPSSLTADIDEFIERWRPCLLRDGSHSQLFLQVRTGNPLTQDSVYQSVARTCYNYTGKRTNPHLLRDMIVTHVRESSDASEKQLEALALFMGHSVQVQRNSYDRRTLTKKVAPAVALMQQVNSESLPLR